MSAVATIATAPTTATGTTPFRHFSPTLLRRALARTLPGPARAVPGRSSRAAPFGPCKCWCGCWSRCRCGNSPGNAAGSWSGSGRRSGSLPSGAG